MKIAYLVHRFPWPSETFISREVADLIEAGVDLQVYSFEGPAQNDQKLLSPTAREIAARTHYISRAEAATALASFGWHRGLGLNRRFSAEATLKTRPALRLARAASVARQLRAAGVSGIHAHWPYGTQIAQLVHEITGLPFSASVHAHEVAHDSGHFPAAFESLRFASFCNAAAMNYLLDRLPAAARDKAHLVYHGVDIGSFAYSPDFPPPRPLRVLSAGRITPTKGFDRLVRACARAAAEGLDLRLTILGRGPASEGLRQIAAEQGFGERLELPGWVSHDEVRRHILDSHVFALMANDDFNDGLPNVVLEAMACGRTAILSPMPAAAEAIEHGRSGFILPSVADEGGMAAFLRQLSADPELPRRMGRAARERVEQLYDSRAHIRRLKALLEQAHT
jgi:glycosyltransferase involved in cell wall biosynthesis